MDRTLRLVARTLHPPRGTAWHGGPTPAGTLRGVSARDAARRPLRGRHTIWELALHLAYWNYAVHRRLLLAMGHERIARFPRSPANWPAMPKWATETAWAADRALLAEVHRRLREVINRFPAALLDRKAAGRRRWTCGDLILGITVHDAYHAGQIQLLKRHRQAR